jgi:hypothetical protein
MLRTPKRRVPIRVAQANREKNRKKPTVLNSSKRRADFKKEAAKLGVFGPKWDTRFQRISLETGIKQVSVNANRSLISKRRNHVRYAKLFELFTRKKNPKKFEIINLKVMHSKKLTDFSIMQYVKRPSLAGLIEYIQKGMIYTAPEEEEYAESLAHTLKKQGLKEEDMLRLANEADQEIKQYFHSFIEERNPIVSIRYSSSNFIFVGVNKQGLPKIAFVDI